MKEQEGFEGEACMVCNKNFTWLRPAVYFHDDGNAHEKCGRKYNKDLCLALATIEQQEKK